MDLSAYLVRHVLGVYSHRFESEPPGVLADEVILLGEYRKKELMEQLTAQGVTHLATRTWEQSAVRIAEDLPGDPSEEGERREPYGRSS